MPESYSLLEFVQQLRSDDELRAEFAGDPHGVLADHGLDGLAAEDVHDALVLVEDTRTVEFGTDPGTGHAFDPGLGPDAAVRHLAEYVGLPAGTGFEVDHTGDIDDLDGYPAASAHAAAVADTVEPEIAPDTTGFGDGFGHAQAVAEIGADAEVETGGPELDSASVPGTDPVYDEPGSYHEFGTDATYDPPHPYDRPADDPGDQH